MPLRANQTNDFQPHDLPLPSPPQEEDYRSFDPQRAEIGQLLFYDKLLSGNRNIACATCHHHTLASADGLSLGIGEGGKGLGTKRTPGIGSSRALRRMQRHSPTLFNLGAKEFEVLFHDGRLSVDHNDPTGFNSPAVEFLPSGLQSILAAQALFPLVSEIEMAGHVDENEIAGARNRRFDYAWTLVAERIRQVSEYEKRFIAAFPEIETATDINIVHIANALDDFINSEWRTQQSPFDAYLHGNKDALTTQQLSGMRLFYGKANCASCHSGPFQTDHKFYSLGLPQFGPGRTRQFDFKNRDMGRINESDAAEDRYRFRTPSLRNVTASPPYGHNGAYRDLRRMVEHHLDPTTGFQNWRKDEVILPEFAEMSVIDFVIQQDQQEQAKIRASVDIKPVQLTEQEISDLLVFLDALKDEYSLAGRLGEPDRNRFSQLLLEE